MGTTLVAVEKVESMKLVVLAARSVRSAPSGLALVLFDNYANAGMIVGQYVLGIKVEPERFGYLYDPETRGGRAVVGGGEGLRLQGDDREKERASKDATAGGPPSTE